MDDIKKGHDTPYERGIKDINSRLVAWQIAVLALDVLGRAEDGAHHDKDTGQIEDEEALAPGDGWAVLVGYALGGISGEAAVAEQGDDDETAADEELHDQAADNDVVARVFGALIAFCEEGCVCVATKAMKSSKTKSLLRTGEYLSPLVRRMMYPRTMYTLAEMRNGCDEEEDGLHDVWAHGIVECLIGRHGSSDISNRFTGAPRIRGMRYHVRVRTHW